MVYSFCCLLATWQQLCWLFLKRYENGPKNVIAWWAWASPWNCGNKWRWVGNIWFSVERSIQMWFKFCQLPLQIILKKILNRVLKRTCTIYHPFECISKHLIECITYLCRAGEYLNKSVLSSVQFIKISTHPYREQEVNFLFATFARCNTLGFPMHYSYLIL